MISLSECGAGGGKWMHAARGGVPVDPARVVVCVLHGRWEIRRAGGHSRLTPSPQAAISIKNAHHERSSIEYMTLAERRDGGDHPCHCVSQCSLKSWPGHESLGIPPPHARQPSLCPRFYAAWQKKCLCKVQYKVRCWPCAMCINIRPIWSYVHCTYV
jgi:hypothetical protein